MFSIALPFFIALLPLLLPSFRPLFGLPPPFSLVLGQEEADRRERREVEVLLA